MDARRDFDLGTVKEIKIEFGSYTAGNEKGSVIYLDDISVRGVYHNESPGDF